jgi:hypothetical protein
VTGYRLAPLVALVALLGGAQAHAQTMIYPPAGRTAEQMGQDRSACDTQAAAQSGYHPSQPPPSVQAPPPASGQRLAGAARGATVGAVRTQTSSKNDRAVENVTGAAAVAGAMAGGARQRQDRRQSAAQTQQQQQAYAQRQAAYNQSFAACMTAKGYRLQ